MFACNRIAWSRVSGRLRANHLQRHFSAGGKQTVPRVNTAVKSEGVNANAKVIARPRAVNAQTSSKRKTTLLSRSLFASLLVVSGIVGYQNDFSLKKIMAKLESLWENVTEGNTGDPHYEDLQAALGPPPPEHYINVIIGLDDLLVSRDWDRRYGWVFEARDGVKELLRFLTDGNTGTFVTLWSVLSSATANDIIMKLSNMVGGPAVHTPPLSEDHIFFRGKNKEKRLEYFNRDPKSLLLIDCDPLSATLNPDNTVIVKSMEEVKKRNEELAKAGVQPSADITCAIIKALINRIREDSQMYREVNVPRSLKNLKKEAVENGYYTDADGLYSFLLDSAMKEEAAAQERLNTGLGGLIRKASANSPILGKRGTVVESAMQKSYRDPALELGQDSILAKKVQDISGKVFGPGR